MLFVYEYSVPVGDTVSIWLPDGAKLLHFGVQNGGFVLWALVDPDRETIERRFRFSGTGHPIDVPADKLSFIGTTITTGGGALAFHLFEILD
jgi:hypothetical protein